MSVFAAVRSELAGEGLTFEDEDFKS